MTDVALRRARTAVSVGFVSFGVVTAVWAVHIPLVAQRLGLDSEALGLLFLGVGAGSLVSQPIAARLAARVGSKRLTALLLPIFLASTMGPILAPTIPAVFAAAVAFGALNGALNVPINMQGAEIEAVRGLPTLPSFHGFFSFGSVAGTFAASAALVAFPGDGRGAALIVMSLVFIVLAFSRSYLPASQGSHRVSAAGDRSLPPPAVIGFAAICFFSSLVEMSVANWSAIYLTSVRAMPVENAGAGFAAFSLTMMVFRFAGGPLVARIGERALVIAGGLLIACGTAVVLLSPWPLLSPFGFAVIGIGSANNYPLLVGAGARADPGSAARAVTFVSMGGLIGTLFGPSAIGLFAQAAGLPAALASLAFCGLVVAAGAAAAKGSLKGWPQRAGKGPDRRRRPGPERLPEGGGAL